LRRIGPSACLLVVLPVFLTACGVAGARSRTAPGPVTPKIAALSKAIAENPANARAWNDRGHAYAMLGDATRARADLEKSLQLQNTGFMHARVAWSYFNLGRHGDALRHWRTAAELNQFKVYSDDYTVALGHWGVGDTARAMECYARAVEREPELGRPDTLEKFIINWTVAEKAAMRGVFDLWRRAYVETPPR
jgi:tetratricopeptide (TPR) repeat protein